MSFVRPEDRSKIAKLVGAIVAVFGCAVWRVAGAMPQASPTAPVVVETPVSTTAAPISPSKPKATDEIDAKPLFAAATVNPFRIIEPAQKAIPAPPATVLPSSIQPLPLPLPSAGPLTLPTTPLQAEPSAPPVRVTGILAGSNATAVLEIGDESRVVRQGQRLPSGFVVSRIDPMTVTLRRGNESVTLDVGE